MQTSEAWQVRRIKFFDFRLHLSNPNKFDCIRFARKFTVFALCVGNHFVVERLAETVRKIAIVGFERVGKRVTLGLED